MSTQVGFELKGFKELGDLLAELPSAVQDKAAVKALRAGANAILAEAQQRAPVGNSDPFSHPAPPGQLRDSLKIRVDKPGIREGSAYIYADPGKGKKVGVKTVYFHLVALRDADPPMVTWVPRAARTLKLTPEGRAAVTKIGA